jgi:hypothetical protein
VHVFLAGKFVEVSYTSKIRYIGQIRMLVATPDEILSKGLEMAYCKKKAEKKNKKKSKDSSS